MIAADNFPVQVACKVVGVSESGFYEHRKLAPSEHSIRHAMLTDLITQIHLDPHDIYGGRRIHGELTLGRGVIVGHNQVQLLMRRAGLAGITGRRKWKRIRTDDIATDLVARDFNRAGPNQPWVTDITEHPTREGKIYCGGILDTYSRRVVGWSIDSPPTGALVTNALGMAINSRLDRQTRVSIRPSAIHSTGEAYFVVGRVECRRRWDRRGGPRPQYRTASGQCSDRTDRALEVCGGILMEVLE